MKKLRFWLIGKFLVIALVSFSFLSICGCEAFKKKFIRKHKEEEKEEDVIFEPVEYPSQQYSNDELYQNHFLLWKSWKQELSDSLQAGVNFKKQVQNSREMLVNLEAMKLLLQEDRQKGLGVIIQNATKINDKIISGSLNSSDYYILKSNLETLEKNVREGYAYKKVKDFIKK